MILICEQAKTFEMLDNQNYELQILRETVNLIQSSPKTNAEVQTDETQTVEAKSLKTRRNTAGCLVTVTRKKSVKLENEANTCRSQ